MRHWTQFRLGVLFLATFCIALLTVAYVDYYRHWQAVASLEEMGFELKYVQETNSGSSHIHSVVRESPDVDFDRNRLKKALSGLQTLTEFSAPQLGMGNISKLDFLAGVSDDLELLDLSDGYDGGSRALSRFRNLKELKIFKTQFDCAELKALKFLTSVSIFADRVENLKDLENVAALTLETIKSLDNLDQLSSFRLQHLGLRTMSLDNAAGIAGSKNSLRSLYIDSCNIADLSVLESMPHIVHLRITNSKIAQFPQHLNLPEVKRIVCFGTNVGDLSVFSGLVALENLSVKIDCDDGVLKLNNFPNLKQISVSLPEVRGISISNCPKLRSIVLGDCGVTRELISRFEEDDCLIELTFARGPFEIKQPRLLD